MSTLFFVHANGFPGSAYKPFFNQLEQHGHTVNFIEKIAHNPAYPIKNNWQHLVDELEDVITGKHEEPVVGIGHSAGGLLSYLLAQRRPDLYSHLILLDPPVINGWQNTVWWLSKKLGFSDRFTPAGASKRRRERFDNREQAYQHLRQKTLFKNFTETAFEAYLDHGLETQDDGSLMLAFKKDRELALYRTSPDNLHRHCKKLTIPGLYLTGEDSNFAQHPFGRRMAERTKMEYHVLTGGGHLFPMEYPTETAQVIAQWLSKY